MSDLHAAVQEFFAKYNAHDVDGMLAGCTADAKGRYLPYGRENIMPIRGGIDAIWRGFTQAVPDFTAEIVEIIPADGDIVVVQAILGGTMPADVPGIIKKGEIGRFAHAYILRFTKDAKISYIDCYWDNSATSFLKASAL